MDVGLQLVQIMGTPQTKIIIAQALEFLRIVIIQFLNLLKVGWKIMAPISSTWIFKPGQVTNHVRG